MSVDQILVSMATVLITSTSTLVNVILGTVESTVRLMLMNVALCPVSMETALTILTTILVSATLATLESIVRLKSKCVIPYLVPMEVVKIW